MAPTTTTKVVEDPPKEEPKPLRLSEMPESIDFTTFEQILEMDDEDDRDFSQGIVFGFFEQAESTFKKMDDALKKEDLDDLSSLGHFLKGSSATLGLTKVKDACEKIQHFGAGKDETGTTDEPEKKTSLDNIKKTLKQARKDYDEVEKALRHYYDEPEEDS